MANDFNPQVGIVGTPSGSQFYTPPVDNTLGQAFTAGARMLDTGLDFFQAAQKSQAQAQATQAISGYSTEVGTLQSSYEQGRISRTQLDAQRRMAYREYSRKFPNQIQEFGQIEKQMFGYSSNAKEEAIVQAGQKFTQSALEKGYMALGTEAPEAQALAVGTKLLQDAENIEYQGKQIELAAKAFGLDEASRKSQMAAAQRGFSDKVSESVVGQTSITFDRILQMNPTELQQNSSQVSIDLASQKAAIVLELNRAYALSARNGASIEPETQRAIQSNVDLMFSNIQSYVDAPNEASKKMIETLSSTLKLDMMQTNKSYALLNTLGPGLGPDVVAGILSSGNRDFLNELIKAGQASVQRVVDGVEGNLNINNLPPAQKNSVVSGMQSGLTGNGVINSPTPEKDAPAFVKTLKSFTTAMNESPNLSDKMGAIATLTSPEFIRNLSFVKGKVPDVELAGIGQAITSARTVLMQEINRVMSSQNPNAYGQNVLGLNPADKEGNFSLNMEPPEAVMARNPDQASLVQGGTRQDALGNPNIGPSEVTPQIQQAVDKLNKLNTVLKLLGEQGPPQVPTASQNNSIGVPTRATGQTKIQGSAGSDRLTGSAGSDNALLNAVRQVESGGNNNAVSPKGALGPYQVMPATAKNPGYGIDPLENPTNPKEARKFATEYLTAMKEEFGGNPYLAVLAYNAGPGPVKKWLAGKGDLPQETIDYAKKIIRELGGV